MFMSGPYPVPGLLQAEVGRQALHPLRRLHLHLVLNTLVSEA